MTEIPQPKSTDPIPTVELVTELAPGDLDDLIDATDSAISDGGGFGWVRLPAREVLERYWRGVMTMPSRILFVGRMDGVICGTAQLITPQKNNEAQNFTVTMTTVFVAPWARGHGLARMMVEKMEEVARDEGYSAINLDVRDSQDVAIKLYESMGYVHFGTNPFYARVDGKIIPGRYYYKVLDPSGLKERPEIDLV
ncbi:N-acetyltransferase family protein [Micavibrio aeruginosavorus]|uniref:GNAT family N-acetyltransferase n=1 Tax=Micavibrio aeruginosavorus TaxID=349221 RepID=UPI003F4A86B9